MLGLMKTRLMNSNSYCRRRSLLCVIFASALGYVLGVKTVEHAASQEGESLAFVELRADIAQGVEVISTSLHKSLSKEYEVLFGGYSSFGRPLYRDELKFLGLAAMQYVIFAANIVGLIAWFAKGRRRSFAIKWMPLMAISSLAIMGATLFEFSWLINKVIESAYLGDSTGDRSAAFVCGLHPVLASLSHGTAMSTLSAIGALILAVSSRRMDYPISGGATAQMIKDIE